MKLNLKRIEIYTNIARTQCNVMDIREAFADLIYNRGNGIKAHALALKVYNSDEETDYTDDEMEMIRRYAEQCTPAVIDAINRMCDDKGTVETD